MSLQSVSRLEVLLKHPAFSLLHQNDVRLKWLSTLMCEAFFSGMRTLFKVPTVLQYAERRPLCVNEQVKQRYKRRFVYFTRKNHFYPALTADVSLGLPHVTPRQRSRVSCSFRDKVSALDRRLCYEACRLYGRGVAQNTARSRCREMPGSLPLPFWHFIREPLGPATTSFLSDQHQEPSHEQHLPLVPQVIFHSGSYLAIKAPRNAIDPFWVVRLDSDLKGLKSSNGEVRFDATNFSATYMESIAPGGICTQFEVGRKVPKTKSKPELIMFQIELLEVEEGPKVIWQLEEEELKRVTRLQGNSGIDDEDDDSTDSATDDSDQDTTRHVAVRPPGGRLRTSTTYFSVRK